MNNLKPGIVGNLPPQLLSMNYDCSVVSSQLTVNSDTPLSEGDTWHPLHKRACTHVNLHI